MTQRGSVVAGRILVIAAGLSVIGAALLLAGVIPIARDTGLIVGGVLLAVGITDGLLGLKLMRREGR